jgi:hypothetical protein
MFGDPFGGVFTGGKSGVDSVAYIPIFAFGNVHSSSGRWVRSR